MLVTISISEEVYEAYTQMVLIYNKAYPYAGKNMSDCIAAAMKNDIEEFNKIMELFIAMKYSGAMEKW